MDSLRAVLTYFGAQLFFSWVELYKSDVSEKGEGREGAS